VRATDIRRSFLDFFAERGHKIWPSASLVPEDPRAPLLTTAGMVQFIPYFYGEKQLDPPRATSCQVVARTTDIEQVGLTARHQTTFEMLGNFSFGDYFKEEAIAWAWELSTGRFGLDPDRIWVTVYETDDESAEIWRDAVGVPAERIVRRGFEDNYWWIPAGPGGPCSELFYDRGSAFGDVEGFQDGDRIMEYWNLVFTQHEVDERGNVLRDLPRRNVDTGMGLERTAQILQGVPTAYETDVLRPILARAEELTGYRYGADEHRDISLRIIGEHVRAASFMIGDGIMPSNESRGYILRRLIRRAARHAKILGVDEVVLPKIVDAVIEVMAEPYPDLAANRAFIEQVLESEEGGFRATLTRGMTLLDDAIAGARQSKAAGVPGETAFKLHDTYGFPFELTLEIVQEAGLDIDRAEFERLMDEQRERARHARKELAIDDTDALRRVLASHGASTFVGYDRTQEEAKVLAVVREGALIDGAREGDEIEMVLDATPFYPEGGGQIGDAGVIETDGARVEVLDTQKRLGDLIVHVARVTAGEITAGIPARASVDNRRRAATQRSHTATHILHALLRGRLGEHARQAGSLVAPGRLRFDFHHFEAVPGEVLAEVEAEVNQHLLADELVKPYETTMDEARNRGALMLFEEKYGDIVRVVEIGDYSIELCGGTHVHHTAQVGTVKILGEASIGSNLRRVEALTGAEAIAAYAQSHALLEDIARLLRTSPEEAPARIEKLLEELRAAEGQVRKSQQAGARARAGELAAAAEMIGDTSVVFAEVPGLGTKELQDLGLAVREAVGGAVAVVLVSAADGRAAIVAALDKATAARVQPRALIADAAKAIGGGAGGKGEVATGGGANAAGVSEALRLARSAAQEELG